MSLYCPYDQMSDLQGFRRSREWAGRCRGNERTTFAPRWWPCWLFMPRLPDQGAFDGRCASGAAPTSRKTRIADHNDPNRVFPSEVSVRRHCYRAQRPRSAPLRLPVVGLGILTLATRHQEEDAIPCSPRRVVSSGVERPGLKPWLFATFIGWRFQ